MPAPRPSLPGTIGRYEVTRVLGQGAMGRVLLARDPVLGRDVAVKVLRDDLNIESDVREGLIVRMRHEAQAAARVSHPNLVVLHDMGEDARVGLYLVFEYVTGANLKERLRTGRLPPAHAARLARELGGALAVAHLAGVLHRDVKPENVMLAPTGAKLTDFGIAKLPDSTLTRAGTLVGTPAYCAPEALAAGIFSPESDQFSLAVTLYEAVSGDRAFPGDDAVGVAAKIATDEPRPIARRCGLPDEVDDLLLRAMSKDPSRRFTSTSEFGDLLAAVLEKMFQPLPVVPAARSSQTTLPMNEAPAPSPTPLRVGLGAATIAIVGCLIGYAAARGTPFFVTTSVPALASSLPSSPASPASSPAPSTTPHPPVHVAPSPVGARSHVPVRDAPSASVSTSAPSSPGPSASGRAVGPVRERAPDVAPSTVPTASGL